MRPAMRARTSDEAASRGPVECPLVAWQTNGSSGRSSTDLEEEVGAEDRDRPERAVERVLPVGPPRRRDLAAVDEDPAETDALEDRGERLGGREVPSRLHDVMVGARRVGRVSVHDREPGEGG